MLKFMLAYRAVIDKVITNKSLELRKYELNNNDWVVIEDFISILKACQFCSMYILLTHFNI
jgi:hypothetical protein